MADPDGYVNLRSTSGSGAIFPTNGRTILSAFVVAATWGSAAVSVEVSADGENWHTHPEGVTLSSSTTAILGENVWGCGWVRFRTTTADTAATAAAELYVSISGSDRVAPGGNPTTGGVNAAGAVMESDYSAKNSLLASVGTIGAPELIGPAARSLVGRAATGNLGAITGDSVHEIAKPVFLVPQGYNGTSSGASLNLAWAGLGFSGGAGTDVGWLAPAAGSVRLIGCNIDVNAYSGATIEIRVYKNGSLLVNEDTGITGTGNAQSFNSAGYASGTYTFAAGDIVNMNRGITAGTATTDDIYAWWLCELDGMPT